MKWLVFLMLALPIVANAESIDYSFHHYAKNDTSTSESKNNSDAPKYERDASKSDLENLIKNMKDMSSFVVMHNIGLAAKMENQDGPGRESSIFESKNYFAGIDNVLKNEFIKVKNKTKNQNQKELIIDTYVKWKSFCESVNPLDYEGNKGLSSEYHIAINNLEASIL